MGPLRRDENREKTDDAGKKIVLLVGEGARHARHALTIAVTFSGDGLVRLLPFGVQLLASNAAYTLGITAAQVVGYTLRISCRTPVLGPTLGLLGVGFASCLAGQASLHSRRLLERCSGDGRASGGDAGGRAGRKRVAAGEGGGGRWWRLEPVDAREALLDAAFGVVLFKIAGGRFSSLMPSDLSAPGALAFESLPALQGGEYAAPSAKRELTRIFRRDGCHHCGSRRGPVIGDHQPPNKLAFAQPPVGQLAAWAAELPGVRHARALLAFAAARGGKGAAAAPVRAVQRFYPQCQRCSLRQASALRHGRRALVLHVFKPRHRVEHLAGIFVGLRHNSPALGPDVRESLTQHAHALGPLGLVSAAAGRSPPFACATLAAAASMGASSGSAAAVPSPPDAVASAAWRTSRGGSAGSDGRPPTLHAWGGDESDGSFARFFTPATITSAPHGHGGGAIGGRGPAGAVAAASLAAAAAAEGEGSGGPDSARNEGHADQGRVRSPIQLPAGLLLPRGGSGARGGAWKGAPEEWEAEQQVEGHAGATGPWQARGGGGGPHHHNPQAAGRHHSGRGPLPGEMWERQLAAAGPSELRHTRPERETPPLVQVDVKRRAARVAAAFDGLLTPGLDYR